MEREEEVSEECIHHWVMPSSSGREKVHGICLNCGDSKEFSNYFEAPDYIEINAALRRAIEEESAANKAKRRATPTPMPKIELAEHKPDTDVIRNSEIKAKRGRDPKKRTWAEYLESVKTLDDDAIQKIREAYKNGESIRKIARDHERSIGLIRKVIRKEGSYTDVTD